jgi:hypothetical protein
VSKKTDKAQEPVCRVTMQYRSGSGYMYELESAGVIVTVHMSRDLAPGGGDHFNAAAHHGRSTPAAVAESGPTRAEALRNVARTWMEKRSELGLPVLDWNGIAAALGAVRAI